MYPELKTNPRKCEEGVMDPKNKLVSLFPSGLFLRSRSFSPLSTLISNSFRIHLKKKKSFAVVLAYLCRGFQLQIPRIYRKFRPWARHCSQPNLHPELPPSMIMMWDLKAEIELAIVLVTEAQY